MHRDPIPARPASACRGSAVPVAGRRAALLAACGLLAASAAVAREATLTLWPEAAVWHDTIRATIEGTGCTRLAGPPELSFPSLEGVIDIDLWCADVPPGQPFSLEVELGPFAPQEYTVQVHDSIRHVAFPPPPPPLATAPLTVHREASLEIEVPGPVTDAEPFTLVLTAPSYSGCYQLGEPTVEGRVIEGIFIDNCPILPIYSPGVYTEELTLGPLPAGTYDIRFFDLTRVENSFPALPDLVRRELVVYAADGCVPSPTTLCLVDGRFKVEVTWEDFRQRTGEGHAVALADREATGLFWFFRPDNVELTVKVLEGCGTNGFWWVFVSSGSTVQYTVTVTDTLTAQSEIYVNDLGERAALRADTTAFECSD